MKALLITALLLIASPVSAITFNDIAANIGTNNTTYDLNGDGIVGAPDLAAFLHGLSSASTDTGEPEQSKVFIGGTAPSLLRGIGSISVDGNTFTVMCRQAEGGVAIAWSTGEQFIAPSMSNQTVYTFTVEAEQGTHTARISCLNPLTGMADEVSFTGFTVN